jgi:hypothetical protein
MITVIDNYYPQSNLYEGMDLSDTLDNMVIGVYETCNDIMMSSLLAEHAYLYENATEIQYVNEAGEETAEGKSLKERFLEGVAKIKEMISTAFKKFIDWISEQTLGIRRKMASVGINEKKITEAKNYIISNNVDLSVDVGGWAASSIREAIKAGYEKDFIRDSDSDFTALKPGDYFATFKVSPTVKTGSLKDGRAIDEAIKTVFSNDLLNNIKSARKSADNAIDEIKKRVAKETPERIGERIGRANDALKTNANIAKDLIKAFNKHYLACAKIASAVIKTAAKDKSDKKSAERQEKFNNSKVGKTVNNAKEKAGEATNNVKAKAGEMVKNGRTSIASGLTNLAGRVANK